MRYYEDPCRYNHHHHHHRPNVEIDVFTGWGGSYYSPAFARPEVVVVNPAVNYMPPVVGSQVIVQPQAQPYGIPMGVTSTTHYQTQQQQSYQYQQQYNNPPYPRW